MEESILNPTFLRSYLNPKQFIILIDSSSKEEKLEETIREIKKAHIVILVYDLNNLECIPSLS